MWDIFWLPFPGPLHHCNVQKVPSGVLCVQVDNDRYWIEEFLIDPNKSGFCFSFCMKQLKRSFKTEDDKPYCHDCFYNLFGWPVDCPGDHNSNFIISVILLLTRKIYEIYNLFFMSEECCLSVSIMCHSASKAVIWWEVNCTRCILSPCFRAADTW